MLRRALNFIAVVLVCLFVVSPSVVAATGDGFSNRQKIYSLDTDLHEALTLLYILQGRSLPSTTGPWSAS